MGFFGGLANVAGLQMANIEANPEQAAVGANTPESTYVMNKTVAPTMDKHYTPTVNMMGGATQGEMQQNAAQGYSNTGPMAANAVGDAVAEYMTAGAATPLIAGQAAADRYAAQNPRSAFAQQYAGLMANPNVNAGVNAQNADINLANGVNKGYSMSSYNNGGLTAAAQHLQAKGRGQDTHLVHMTAVELNAMQKLAEKHGGSLTVNPHTGLPEAGFLSSVLPMALGAVAAATGQEWAVPLAMAMSAGGEYAYTGSLTQGLMAGLSAWGGAGLESGIEGLGSATMDTSAGLTSAGAESVPTEALPQGSSEFQAAQSNLGPEAEGMTANQVANANVLPSTPNAPGPSSMDLLGKGLTSGNLGSYAMDHLGQVAAVGVPLLSGATSLFKQPTVPTATNTSTNPFGMKTIPKDANGNPIFNASIPAVPSPHYQATYPNYVQNPYHPTMAASGGLMDIPKYSGADYGSMVTGANEMQQGLAQATSPQQLSELQKELIAAGQENSKNGVYHLSDIEYAKMTPAALMKAHKIAVAKGLQPVGQLGDYETTPAAAIAQADIDKAAQQKTSAKEGGLMSFAVGGDIPTYRQPASGMGAGGDFKPTGGMLSNALVGFQNSSIPNIFNQGTIQGNIYHPQYQNYAQQQYQPQASGGIPMPTRPAAVGSAGRPIANLQSMPSVSPIGNSSLQTLNSLQAQLGLPLTQSQTMKPGQIDPTLMQGSPAYNAMQGQISQLQAQLAAAQPQQSSGDGGGGAAHGGLMGAHHHIQDGHLGSFSDGGRLLKGPGDGVSDGIPATIGGKQPARLADGEFVIPARIVSELGNGSTDAGAKRLYAMMDRIKHARKKAKDIAADTKAYKYLPA